MDRKLVKRFVKYQPKYKARIELLDDLEEKEGLSPDEIRERDLLKNALMQYQIAKEALRGKDLEIIELYYEEGLDLTEVSLKVDCSISSVQRYRNRAIDILDYILKN